MISSRTLRARMTRKNRRNHKGGKCGKGGKGVMSLIKSLTSRKVRKSNAYRSPTLNIVLDNDRHIADDGYPLRTFNTKTNRWIFVLDIDSHGLIAHSNYDDAYLEDDDTFNLPLINFLPKTNIHTLIKINKVHPGNTAFGCSRHKSSSMLQYNLFHLAVTHPEYLNNTEKLLQTFVDTEFRHTVDEVNEFNIGTEEIGRNAENKSDIIVQPHELRKNLNTTYHTIFKYVKNKITAQQGLYDKEFTWDTEKESVERPNSISRIIELLKQDGFPVKNNSIYLSEILKHISDTYGPSDVYIIDRSCHVFVRSKPKNNKYHYNAVNGGKRKTKSLVHSF